MNLLLNIRSHSVVGGLGCLHLESALLYGDSLAFALVFFDGLSESGDFSRLLIFDSLVLFALDLTLLFVLLPLLDQRQVVFFKFVEVSVKFLRGFEGQIINFVVRIILKHLIQLRVVVVWNFVRRLFKLKSFRVSEVSLRVCRVVCGTTLGCDGLAVVNVFVTDWRTILVLMSCFCLCFFFFLFG